MAKSLYDNSVTNENIDAVSENDVIEDVDEAEFDEAEDTADVPKRKSLFDFLTEEEQEDEELKENIKAEYDKLLNSDLYSIGDNHYDHPVDVARTDNIDVKDAYADYYNDLNVYHATLHAKGSYDPEVDTLRATGPRIQEMRDRMISESPELLEIDRAVTDRANHQLNINDELMRQGGASLADCKFKDAEGNPINIDFNELAESGKGFDEAYAALYYGLDHGTITCEMPNGKDFDMSKVNDTYMSRLDYYDAHSREMDEHLANIHSRNREEYEQMSFEERDKLTPDFVSQSNREQFQNDAIARLEKNEQIYGDIAKGYENDGNPYEAYLVSVTDKSSSKDLGKETEPAKESAKETYTFTGRLYRSNNPDKDSQLSINVTDNVSKNGYANVYLKEDEMSNVTVKKHVNSKHPYDEVEFTTDKESVVAFVKTDKNAKHSTKREIKSDVLEKSNENVMKSKSEQIDKAVRKGEKVAKSEPVKSDEFSK